MSVCVCDVGELYALYFSNNSYFLQAVAEDVMASTSRIRQLEEEIAALQQERQKRLARAQGTQVATANKKRKELEPETDTGTCARTYRDSASHRTGAALERQRDSSSL